MSSKTQRKSVDLDHLFIMESMVKADLIVDIVVSGFNDVFESVVLAYDRETNRLNLSEPQPSFKSKDVPDGSRVYVKARSKELPVSFRTNYLYSEVQAQNDNIWIEAPEQIEGYILRKSFRVETLDQEDLSFKTNHEALQGTSFTVVNLSYEGIRIMCEGHKPMLAINEVVDECRLMLPNHLNLPCGMTIKYYDLRNQNNRPLTIIAGELKMSQAQDASLLNQYISEVQRIHRQRELGEE